VAQGGSLAPHPSESRPSLSVCREMWNLFLSRAIDLSLSDM